MFQKNLSESDSRVSQKLESLMLFNIVVKFHESRNAL